MVHQPEIMCNIYIYIFVSKIPQKKIVYILDIVLLASHSSSMSSKSVCIYINAIYSIYTWKANFSPVQATWSANHFAKPAVPSERTRRSKCPKLRFPGSTESAKEK